eukprot:3744271-Rhodomonas_salina.1
MRCPRGDPSERSACTTAGGESGAFKLDSVHDERGGLPAQHLLLFSRDGLAGPEKARIHNAVWNPHHSLLLGASASPLLGEIACSPHCRTLGCNPKILPPGSRTT